MNLNKLNDWAATGCNYWLQLLQLAAALGVIAGLILVATEIQQNEQLTRAQLNSDTFTSLEELARSMQQEPLALALAKSYEAPQDLTVHERIIIDGFYREVYHVVIRESAMIYRGIYEDNLNWQSSIFADLVLTSEYGRVWWKENKNFFGSRTAARVDRQAADSPPEPVMDQIVRINELLQREMEQEK